MKIKLELSEWFYNMGLVGFNRILKKAEEDDLIKLNDYNYNSEENFLEFENTLLENFHEYYFNYFFNRYDVHERTSKQLHQWFIISKKEEKFESALKVIKDTIKKINDKIKKYDEEAFMKSDEIYKTLSKVKKYDNLNEVEKCIEDFLNVLSKENINKKLTLNMFKFILSSSFFGQVSFLNVVSTNKSLQEQKDIMFKDYIKPILEEINLNENIQGNAEEVFLNIKEALKTVLSKDIEKVYKTIEKNFIKKKKNADEIRNFIDGNEYHTCSLCCNNKSFGGTYAEGSFTPLAVSADNSKNMFWEFNTEYPICNLCKLVLFCTPAGCIDIYKNYMGKDVDIENKHYFAFVNMDTNFDELCKYNNNLEGKKDKENPYKEFIIDIVEELQQKSAWQLQNILFVEFNADYSSKKSKMNYFNMPKYVALYFAKSSKSISAVKDELFKSELIDNILSGKDIKFIIDKKLRDCIKKNNNYAYDCFNGVIIRNTLSNFRGGYENMEGKTVENKNEQDAKRLYVIYARGQELNEYFKESNAENKISSIAYRLLNSAKANNKNEFMDTLIRVHISAQKEIPAIFLNSITEKDFDFENVAHAFISGLISGKFEKSDNKEEK